MPDYEELLEKIKLIRVSEQEKSDSLYRDYTLPDEDEIKRLFEHKLKSFDSSIRVTEKVIKSAKGLSQAEIVRVCDDVIKYSILDDVKVTASHIIKLLEERHTIYTSKEA